MKSVGLVGPTWRSRLHTIVSMGQFKFIVRLAYWYLQNKAFEFKWDSANMTKSTTNHGVKYKEVDEERLCVVGPAPYQVNSFQWFLLFEMETKTYLVL